jgi:hypothetical protein
MSKEIIVTIGLDGNTQVETKGFEGASCLKETEELEAALGGNRRVRRTGEFFKTETRNTVKAKTS